MTYECFHCGKPFTRYPSQVKNPDKAFCSVDCKGKWQKVALKGTNNPNYRTGATIEQSICGCGSPKDHRSSKCALCAKTSSPVGVLDAYSQYDSSLLLECLESSSDFTAAAKLAGCSRTTITTFCKENDIDVSHMVNAKGRSSSDKVFILRESGKRRNSVVSKWLKSLYPELYLCGVCWNPGEWRGQPVTLDMHHINGNSLDDRIENLVWLCPNCHAQTKNYRGKNPRKEKEK